jgi:hypothetical protein
MAVFSWADLLGMSLVAGALIITLICVSICVAIGVCCYCCLRRPRVMVSQPVMVAYAQPHAYQQQPPQNAYQNAYPQQQQQQYAAAPQYGQAYQPSNQQYQQPLLNQQQTSHL